MLRVALIVVAMGLSGGACSAQCLGGGFGGWGGWGGYGIGYLNPLQFESMPYYSMYPPVYYSYPVARPYGYSPFAYPPGTMTPDVVASAPIAPETIVNPHAGAALPSPEKAPADDALEARVTSHRAVRREPVAGPIVRNPYVIDENLAGR